MRARHVKPCEITSLRRTDGAARVRALRGQRSSTMDPTRARVPGGCVVRACLLEAEVCRESFCAVRRGRDSRRRQPALDRGAADCGLTAASEVARPPAGRAMRSRCIAGRVETSSGGANRHTNPRRVTARTPFQRPARKRPQRGHGPTSGDRPEPMRTNMPAARSPAGAPPGAPPAAVPRVMLIDTPSQDAPPVGAKVALGRDVAPLGSSAVLVAGLTRRPLGLDPLTVTSATSTSSGP